jgi:hypothetical protein
MRLSNGRRLGGIGLSIAVFVGVTWLDEALLGGGWQTPDGRVEVALFGVILALAAVVVFWILWRREYASGKDISKGRSG